MYLYNYTIVPPSLPLKSIVGQFLGDKTQQLVCATSSTLTVYKVDGELHKLSFQNGFGIIQNIDKITIGDKLGAGSKDYLVITSDSGVLVIAEFKDNKFVAISQQPHSKNGLRRQTPGEYLDINGNTISITAIEKNRLMYRLHSNEDGMFLSSPLTATTNITIDTCSLNSGLDNPKFAAIEFNKSVELVYYELDQGLNYIIKRSEPLPDSANMLIPLESGLLVCGEGFILYNKETVNTEHTFINYVMHKSFTLVQTTKGELYKLTIPLKLEYFNKVPVAKSLNLFKKGFLFVNVLGANKVLYQLEDLEGTISSVDELQSYEPILNLDLTNNDEHLKLLSTNNLKTLIHGINIDTLVSSPIDISPISVQACKNTQESVNDEYLFLSSTSSTLILSIGEVVEKITDSEFITNQPTLKVQQVGNKGIIQIYSNGMRHLVDNKIVKDWYPPAGINILRADANNRQLLIGLTNNEIIYFEIEDDSLVEYPQRLDLGQITGIGISENYGILGILDTIYVISLQSHNRLDTLSLQALSSNAISIIVKQDLVHIGMESGLYVKSSISEGKLSDTKVKYLGTKPVRLSIIGEYILGVSSKTWLIGDKITPLNTNINCGASFISEDIGGEGIVGCQGNELLIFTLGELNDITVVEDAETTNSRKAIDDIILETKGVRINDKFIEISNGLSMTKFNDFIIVGTRDYIYTLKNSGEMIHRTKIDLPATSMIQFNHNQILVGMGNYLRLYELGQKQLLRKSSTTFQFLNQVIKLTIQGQNRIVIGDSKSSTTFAKYDKDTNEFIPLANDTINRQITCLTTLDHDTVIGGDKFGNIFINKMIDNELLNNQDSYLNGSNSRLKTIAEFHVQDIPMSIAKGTLIIGGQESIIYGGIQGTIGILTPLSQKEYSMFNDLQIELRKEPNLLDKDQMKYRSYYNANMNIIDGDFVEQFNQQSLTSKINITSKIKKSTRDIENKIYEIRQRSAF